MIEGIEELRSEFEFVSLGYYERFKDARIEVLIPGPWGKARGAQSPNVPRAGIANAAGLR